MGYWGDQHPTSGRDEAICGGYPKSAYQHH